MKHLLKKSLSLLIALVILISLSACGAKNIETNPAGLADVDTNKGSDTDKVVEKEIMKIGTLMGPTGMGMVQLMDKNEKGEAALNYDVTVMGSPDDLVGKIISGEVDVAAVPTNLALVLYNRTGGAVQLAAVNTMGVLYVLENGSSIQSIADLKGKTVNTSGKGASPDFIFKYLLAKNNMIVDKDVMLDFSLQHSELAASLVAGDVNIALLPQPHVTTALMKNKDLRIALDITEEWDKATGGTSKLAMGCIIVQKEYAEKNKKAFNAFLSEYKDSTDYVNNDIDGASALIEKFGILPNAAVAKNAIPYSSIVYVDASEAKPFLEDLYNVLYEFEPKSVGGKLADEGFYYKK